MGPEILRALDPEQRAAATVREGPLLIVAGPGTGKTRTLTHRLAWLISECGVPASACLALTFTRRAAQEMRERLEALIAERARDVTLMTFHALGLKILRELGPKLGLTPELTVLDETARQALVEKTLGMSASRAKRLVREIARCKRTGTRPDADGELLVQYEAYERALRAAAAVDYEDLVLLPVRLLEGSADAHAILRSRYRWVSVDEYQDLDPLQYRLVRLLVPPEGNLCVIGDPDQAIYGFRGGDVGLFGRFREDYPNARVVHLTRNYRSSRVIVDAAVQAMAPASLVPGRQLEAIVGGERKISIHAAATDRAEAEFVVHTIEQLVAGHSFFSLDSGRTRGASDSDLSFSDFAVLYRTEAQAQALSEALGRSGMPYQARSHRRLGETAPNADPGEGPSSEAARLSVDERVTGCEVDTWDPRAERISLLTLHASKGLEFRVVFIVGCEDGLLPLRFGNELASSVDEERRLLFVGMTRARERLVLSHARRRFVHGRERQGEPSPFLRDIEAALFEHLQSEARRAREPKTDQLDLF